ncbi:lytic polysaccharide monooxygenase [Pseudomonas asplenii]|uniref:lytic polysaccharide monooxygenase n=1 Tax=Pseudomonas asplenii TaxID=53407 RepID=UPI000360B67C|nr:lytic polysaccharide monooxygenase [Pseudomonas fuscovaginae]
MNRRPFPPHPLLSGALAALLAVPALGWAHGAVDSPVSRQTLCRGYADYWGSADKMKDEGCRRAVTAPGHAGQMIHAATQWNEVNRDIGGRYNDADGGEAFLKTQVPDGKICSVNRPGMDVLNLAMPEWTRTEVKPDASGNIAVRLITTAAHVPSFVRIYLSNADYDSTLRPLRWDDLQLVHTEELTQARKDWGNKPPLISDATGFFQFQVRVPPGRTGNAVLFTWWQRRDPVGEGFYGCSDITFGGMPQPSPWFKEKVFIDGNGIDPKPGDTVHYRVFGHDREVSEVVDLKLPITASNQAPAVWGKQLAEQLASNRDVIRVGVNRNDNGDIVFDSSDVYKNFNYLSDARNSTQMSVDTAGGEVPGPIDERPPVAVIDGPTEVKAGERFTMSGRRSTSYNGTPLRYAWSMTPAHGWSYGSNIQESFSITAPVTTTPSTTTLRLTVLDDANRKRGEVEQSLTAMPGSGGGDYPAYKEGENYKAGDIVSNAGGNYKCKPWPYTAWCAGAAWAYAPGSGVHWQEAWEKL